MASTDISKDIFRTYDIRGQVGREWCLNENYSDAFLIGQAIGAQLVRRNSKNIVIGRDGRSSSPFISENLINGLMSTGCIITDLGITATPILYFALTHLDIPNGIMITGSHNPADHNGIKIVYEFAPITDVVIQSLYYDIQIGEFVESKSGKHIHHDSILDNYQTAITADIDLKQTLKIGIDCGNGATSLFSESLFKKLGCEVHPLFCEMDCSFPNHSPDPTVPKNLSSLIDLVKKEKLDLGIAFDGDGDRLIIVDGDGKIIWPDRLIILLAQDILQKHPASPVVFDVKCSYLLPTSVQKAGGQPAMCASGHSILKLQMIRLDAVLGGEFSGHIVIRDRWSDFDDGPYVAARVLEVLTSFGKTNNLTPTEVFAQIPDSFSTPQYELSCDTTQEADTLLEDFISHADFSSASLSLVDGIRVDYDDGWGLARSSNTSACLTFRFEAKTQERLKSIQDQFRSVFDKIDSTHTLPF